MDVRPTPGDEKAPIAELNSAIENARREAATMRKTDSDLLTAANSLREEAKTLTLRPVPQATSTVQPASVPSATIEGRPGVQGTATPGPEATPQPGATPRPNESPRPIVAPTADSTPSKPLTRPTAPPARPSDQQFAVSSRFRSLASQIAAQVGQPTDKEKTDPATGNVLQATTGGMLIWKKSTNLTYFTDGFVTWVNGPRGLEYRQNDELLDWERALGP
jgi:hypothetical protein